MSAHMAFLLFESFLNLLSPITSLLLDNGFPVAVSYSVALYCHLTQGNQMMYIDDYCLIN
jgi:hypothetical protein